MRNWEEEIKNRVDWIKNTLKEANANGVVLGLSGGKDSAAVAALCKMATENVVGVIMPCGNMKSDSDHGYLLAEKFNVEVYEMDFKKVYNDFVKLIEKSTKTTMSDIAKANMKPRMRMTTLYGLAQTKGLLVAGTGNFSEWIMGYFTKWGDGGCDFNPIGDLCATEIFELCRALHVPAEIIDKAPSAGLWEGQTDEQELGISYERIDSYLESGEGPEEDVALIEKAYNNSKHKRHMPKMYSAK